MLWKFNECQSILPPNISRPGIRTPIQAHRFGGRATPSAPPLEPQIAMDDVAAQVVRIS